MSVREAILAYTKGQSRHRIYIEEDIPLKKLEAARSKYVDGDDEVIVLVDDTVFGSGKDGICVGEDHLYVKQLLEKPKSFPIKSIRSLASKTKSFSSLEIYINGDLFVSLSQIEKEEHGYLMGILKAAQRGAKPPVEKSEPKPRRQASSSQADQTRKAANVSCSQCNSILQASAKFCPECGMKVLPKGICAACSSKLPKNAKFCPQCGSSIDFGRANKISEISTIEKSKGRRNMILEFDVVYFNGDNGERDEQTFSIETDNQEVDFLTTVCSSRPTEETFVKFFKRIYDNPTMDGAEKGILYDEIWSIMSRWAFDKLGWHDVTVDVIGLRVDGENMRIDENMMDIDSWSIQLSREGFMYCRN